MTSSLHNRAPTIETERLRLREQSPDALDMLVEYWGREDVYRHIDGAPRPREDVWRRLLANAGTWALLGFGSWLVETHEGEFIGTFGFLEARREMAPPFNPGEIEVGWGLAPEAQGKGYALEALSALLAWGDRELSGRKLVCIINPDNAPSLKLAAKTGFRERGLASYHGQDVIQFERIKI
jgi:RimJ/RimL family protein N-acetyltransferase